MFRILLLTLCGWLTSLPVSGAAVPPDSLRWARLYEQWQAVRHSHPDSSLTCARQLYQLARQSKRPAELAESLFTMGITERDRGNYAEAVLLFRQALPYREQLNDHAGRAAVYQSLALTYKRMGDSQHVTALTEQALTYAQQAYALFGQLGSSPGTLSNAQNTIGIIQRDLNRLDAARQAYQASIDRLEPIQSMLSNQDLTTLALVYGNMGQIMVANQQYDKAVNYFNKALTINTKTNRLTSIEHNQRNLADVYRLRNDLPTSVLHAQKALQQSRQIGDPHRLFNTLSVVYKTYRDIGDYKLALALLEEQKLVEDSLLRADKARQIVTLHAQYDNERTRQLAEVSARKDWLLAETRARLELEHDGDLARIDADKQRDLSRVRAKAELDKAELKAKYKATTNQLMINRLSLKNSQQRHQLIWLGAGAACCSLLAGLLWFIYRRVRDSRAKIQAQSEQLRLLMRELHHRVKNNLAVVSGLLELQANRLGDTPVRQAFVESQQRVQAMSLIHQRLYQTDATTKIDLHDYTHSLVDSLMAAYGYTNDELIRQIVIDVDEADVDVAVPLGLIMNELLTNAFKYAFPVARPVAQLTLRIWQQNGLHMVVADNGPGLNLADWQAVGRLGQRSSFGCRLITSLSDQMGGDLHIDVKQGTRFTLFIPTNTFRVADRQTKHVDHKKMAVHPH